MMDTQRIVNCTPHDVVLYDVDDIYYDALTYNHRLKEDAIFVVCFRPSGNVARCDYTETGRSYINGIPIVNVEFQNIKGLPEPKEGTWYIVSSIVANAAKKLGRTDVLIPVRMVRDKNDNVVGCTAFSKP